MGRMEMSGLMEKDREDIVKRIIFLPSVFWWHGSIITGLGTISGQQHLAFFAHLQYGNICHMSWLNI